MTLLIFNYLPVIVPVLVLLVLLFTMKEKTGGGQQAAAYLRFTCSGCGKTLRVPTGKGRIRVKCPGCSKQIEMKT